MTPQMTTVLAATQIILSIGLMVEGLEGYVARELYGPKGPWLPTRDGDGRSGGVAKLARACAGAEGMGAVFLARALAAAWLVMLAGDPMSRLAVALRGLLLLSSVLLVVRTRGPLCGGSDAMSFQVQLGLLVATAGGTVNPVWVTLGLGWIAVQSVLSYFLAGWGKAGKARWWNGQALAELFQSQGLYVLWEGTRGWGGSLRKCAVLSWGVLLFQLLFPLVLVAPFGMRVALVVFALAFHVTNAAVLGLNRFIWAWAATYPALLYFGAAR